MLLSVARAKVFTATGKTENGKVSTAQCNEFIAAEYTRLQRVLSDWTGVLYSEETEPLIVEPGETVLPWPLGFDRLIKLERLCGSKWRPVPAGNGLDEGCLLSFVNRGQLGGARLTPDSQAPGTYRVTYYYVEEPAIDVDTDLDLIPAGLDDIYIQRAAALVQDRCDDDPSKFERRALQIWNDQKDSIRRQYGQHTRSAQVSGGGW